MADLKVSLCGIELDNPVIPASGTFGYGYEFAQLYDINILGTFSFKGTTREPRFGNPTPRIAECTAGLINAVGLQNPGVDQVIGEELPRLERVFHKKVMANVSGFSVDDYVYSCRKLDACDQVGWLEVNVSCPKACEEAGADGLSLINTMLGMRIDLNTRRPVVANTMGGFSGPAIFPVALRMVYQVSQAVNIPVIGVGGVASAENVIEMLLAGATAVEVGAANLVNPFACRDIIEALPAAMKKYHINALNEIIGGCSHG